MVGTHLTCLILFSINSRFNECAKTKLNRCNCGNAFYTKIYRLHNYLAHDTCLYFLYSILYTLSYRKEKIVLPSSIKTATIGTRPTKSTTKPAAVTRTTITTSVSTVTAAVISESAEMNGNILILSESEYSNDMTFCDMKFTNTMHKKTIVQSYIVFFLMYRFLICTSFLLTSCNHTEQSCRVARLSVELCYQDVREVAVFSDLANNC